MKISMYDTSICDDNLGNQIIMDAVTPVIEDLFSNDFIIKLQYLEKFGEMSHRHIRESEYTFFGGTNALSSQMNRYAQMGFKMRDAFRVNNVVLVGVGWWQYQKKPNFYTRILLKKILHKEAIHSVRDDYTKRYLESIGITNVVNTSCPSTWCLSASHCEGIPIKKSKNVICTITDYHHDAKSDAAFINMLIDNYETCSLWIQGAGDSEYFHSLNIPHAKVSLIPPKLDALDDFLRNEDADYVGTRLHAGIRALQHRKRSLILGIDNRALELGRGIGLNVCQRDDLKEIGKFVQGEQLLNEIKIPEQEIALWKNQFVDPNGNRIT